MPKKLACVISPGGVVRHLADDASAAFFDKLGAVTHIERSSHIEVSHELSARAVEWLEQNYPDPRSDKTGGMRGALESIFKLLLWADLTPVNGPVLGPFRARGDAVEAEQQWLFDHGFPAKPACQPPPTA